MNSLFDRIPPLQQARDFLSRKTVPKHRFTFLYYFGGVTLFLFVVQLITGILLSIYYSPHPDHAHESVRRIMTQVEFGWLVRSLHSWGASLMVAFVLLHMFTVYFTKAYRKPREAMWFSGVILLFFTLGFAFTGYLLPWDVTAYHATQIGTEIPRSIPVIGELSIQLLRGESEIGSEALKRMYVLHVVILPMAMIFVVCFHIILQQALGTSIPIGIEAHGEIPFFPNFIYRDFFAWTIVTAILVVLSTMLPTQLGEKADPLASAPVGIKPEWYFLPLYQTLRIFPTNVLGLNGEMLVNSFVLFLAIIWLLIPLLDAKAKQDRISFVFVLIGVGLIAYCISMIIAAYFT